MSASLPEPPRSEQSPADFESAIEATGYGLFNILLLTAAMICVLAVSFEPSTVSYVLSSAECDLGLSLLDMGILNAMTFAGIITSAFAWGYIADTKGRKMNLSYGLLLDGVCVLGSALSQNFIALLIFRYFGGFLICGASGVIVSYIAEMHSLHNRERAVMVTTTFLPVAYIVLPLLALSILPQEVNFSANGLTFHSWHIFLALCSLPSFISGLMFWFLPESPKFLMSRGHNEEALQVFQQMYALNYWQPKENYPIKKLKNESPASTPKHDTKKTPTVATVETSLSVSKPPVAVTKTQPKSVSWQDGFSQLKPLFRKPLLGLSIKLYWCFFWTLFGQQTFLLWLPQLFASTTEFENMPTYDGVDPSICTILEYSVNKTGVAIMPNATESVECKVIITAESYTNNITVAVVGLVAYIFASIIVKWIGLKNLLIGSLLVCGTSGICLYLCTSSVLTIAVSSIYLAVACIACTTLLAVPMVLFPTSLRSMVVTLGLMFGRLSGIFGNILFPIFMSSGCIAPFLMIGLVMYLACIPCVFLPINSKSALK